MEEFKDLKVKVSEEDFAIVKSRKVYLDAFANIKDDKETTVIIEENKINKKDIINIEGGWNLITFDTVLDFNLVGFIAKISGAFAKENISIFVISSYSTDHVLVKRQDLDKAIEVLHKLGVDI